MKSACNKSCRSLCMDSRTVEFSFSDFSTIFKRIYKFAVFENKKKRKRDLASRPMERFGGSHIRPWPEPGTEKAAAGWFPARELAGGGG